MKIQPSNQDLPLKAPGQKSNSRDYSKIPQPYIDVAKKMETEFAKLMVQKMKDSSQLEDEANAASDFYDSLMTQEQAEQLTKREGLGISHMILNQIYPESKRTDQNMQAFLRSSGQQQGGNHE